MSITPSEVREMREKMDRNGKDIAELGDKAAALENIPTKLIELEHGVAEVSGTLSGMQANDTEFRAALQGLTATVNALAEELRALKSAPKKAAKKD